MFSGSRRFGASKPLVGVSSEGVGTRHGDLEGEQQTYLIGQVVEGNRELPNSSSQGVHASETGESSSAGLLLLLLLFVDA